MKRIIFSLIFILTIFASCEDFLTVVPESTYSVESGYRTQKDFTQAIAGTYSLIQAQYNGGWLYLMIARGDDTRTLTDYQDYTYGVAGFTDGDNSGALTTCWKRLWTIVYRSNMILGKIDNAGFDDPALRDYIKGEAYMLRAYAYHTLGWHFGGMPLIDKILTVEETETISRSTQEATLALAIKDYQSAYDLLPEKWTGSNTGRVTKYAAAGMLGRLYMCLSDFSNAKTYLSKVISSQQYDMEKKYIDCFTDAKDNGLERVWEAQFTGGQTGQGQNFATGMFPQAMTVNPAIMPFIGTTNARKISADFMSEYEPGDIRKAVSTITGLTIDGVFDNTTSYILKYSHYEAYTPKTQSDWANNIPILRYTDVKMMYAEALNEEAYAADGEAFQILNEVRKRAGLPALSAVDLPDQKSFKQAIIKERRVEFAFEGLRWPDLVRWGIAQEVMNKFFAGPQEGSGRYNMKAHQTIFAVPNEEITRYDNTDVMWQNSGY